MRKKRKLRYVKQVKIKMVQSGKYFGVLNRVGVAHKRDGQMGRPHLATIAHSNMSLSLH